MKKLNTPAVENIWDETIDPVTLEPEVTEEKTVQVSKQTKTTKQIKSAQSDFDLEGLMTDFPTAKDLERFVYDETSVVLNLKGRANKLKYQIALDVLNGEDIDPKYIGGNNPYIDKAEMIPTEDLKPTPARDPALPDQALIQNSFYSPFIVHPDPDMRAQDKKVHMLFRKYKNGMISYEILGPLEQKPYGEKIDKFGRIRPEIIKWIDPRTGEQTVMREDGTLTPQGKRLRATMQTLRVNNTNQWDVWIDRELVGLEDSVAHNVWDLSK